MYNTPFISTFDGDLLEALEGAATEVGNGTPAGLAGVIPNSYTQDQDTLS